MKLIDFVYTLIETEEHKIPKVIQLLQQAASIPPASSSGSPLLIPGVLAYEFYEAQEALKVLKSMMKSMLK